MEERYTAERRNYWDRYWGEVQAWRLGRKFYQETLAAWYRFAIPPGGSVLELGCGRGDLLARLGARRAVGIDLSPVAITAARVEYPALEFHVADARELAIGECFDYVILSDLVNDLWDVQRVLEQVSKHCHRRTRVLLNLYNNLWMPIRWAAEVMGMAKVQLRQNWISPEDLIHLLSLSGFEIVSQRPEILCPVKIPVVSGLLNRYLARLWPLSRLALTQMVVARRSPVAVETTGTVSVIVPARNEEGNIAAIFERMPEMGAGTELIFVEGGSTDGTRGAIEREMSVHPGRNVKLLRQPGKGKGDAVRTGFAAANGELLMILDADLTVAPEDLSRFYEAWRSGRGEFINGVRLVYPMEAKAMRLSNQVANHFFARAFRWLLQQPIKDTLCGTKVLSKVDYETIAANRAYFGDFDPYGDFDLIFGAARFHLKMLDLPVRYGERTYGETNIHRWSGGAVLLRMVVHALRRIKFV